MDLDGTRLYLIRHGETEWNRDGRMQGHADVGLSPEGEDQARRVAWRLERRAFAALYSSDLRRAARTAEIIGEALGLAPVFLPSLREVDLGALSGLTSSEILERYPELYGKNRRPEARRPGGESDLEHRDRVWTAVRTLAGAHPGRDVLLVSHGGTLRAVISAALGQPPDRRIPVMLENGSLSILSHRYGEWQLALLNDCCHLVGRATAAEGRAERGGHDDARQA